MADLLTTLHPINDDTTDLYPNVKRDNLPQNVKDELDAIPNKVDKVQGKGLSTNDFTNEDKALVDTIPDKVDKVTGKGLSTNDYTNADKALVDTIPDKVNKEQGKGLSTNDFTNEDKALVDTIPNKVDKVTGKGLSTNDFTDADKALVDTIPDKVNKEQGKGLSTNDYTNADKNAVEVAIPLRLSYLNTNILDLYRMVIRSGGMITVTDASVALASQPFPSTVSPKALLNYVGGMCQKVGDSIITAPVTTVISKGFNQWDEEWRNGYYNSRNGDFVPSGNSLANKTPIRVKGGETYYLKSATYSLLVFFYDNDGNFISLTSLLQNQTFVTPNNAGFINICNQYNAGSAYNHDICINVSNATMNGTYKPYSAPVYYPIHRDIRALDGYGYGLSADCYNYIDFERKVFVKKVAQYAFQSGEWIATTANRFYTSSLRGVIKPSTLNLIALGLTTVSKSDVETEDYQIGVDVDGTIYVHLTDSSTLADVEAFFGGKSIYFELATPVETDISDLLRYTFPTYDIINVIAGGYLEFENENNIGVPYSVTYQSKPNTQATVLSAAQPTISEVDSNDPTNPL